MDYCDDGGGAMSLTSRPLHEIIKERKAEKLEATERKRRMDLQRIYDMQSTSGIDPFELFPQTVWELIIANLGPEDRGNLWCVHTTFRDLMSVTRIRDILFPQMLKVVQFWLSIWKNLRPVSRSMRNAVDSWIDKKLLEELHGLEPHDKRFSLILNIDFSNPVEMERQGIKLMKKVESFNNEDGTIMAQSVFERSLLIKIRKFQFQSEESSKEKFVLMKNYITTVLELIGHKIWYFDFSAMTNSNSELSEEFYILFASWASLMPNLKWVAFEGVGVKIEENHPFPLLNFLEGFTFRVHVNETDRLRIYERIIGTNPHIKFLDFKAFPETEGDSLLQYLTSDFTKSLQLQAFNVGYCCANKKLVNIKDIQDLNFNWRLRSINLHCVDVGGTLDTLFKFLGRFPTLEIVELHSVINVRIDENVSFLMLPNLTFLHMRLKVGDSEIDYGNSGSSIHFFFSLEFLLFCKKLKTLEWSLKLDNVKRLRRHLVRYECHERMINFRGGFRDVYHSNVWNVFPYLQKVSFDYFGEISWKCGFREYNRSELIDVRNLLR